MNLGLLERATGALMVTAGLVLAVPAGLGRLEGSRGTATDPKSLLGSLDPELSDRPIVLALHSPGCPACARMAPRVEQLRHDCIAKKVGVVALDVAEPPGAELARAYGVSGVPTVLLLDTHRVAEGVLVGEHSLGELRAAAAGLVRGTCGSETPRARDPGPIHAACEASAPTPASESTCPG